MKKIKITQVKSAIDRPNRQKLTLLALGLKKLNSTRDVEATDQILGMVRTVNHLLKVEEVQSSNGSSNATGIEDVVFQTSLPAEATIPESAAGESDTTQHAGGQA